MGSIWFRGQSFCHLYALFLPEKQNSIFYKFLLTVWSLFGNLGIARCWEMSFCLQDTSYSTNWHQRAAVGHWVLLCVKCCRMVDSLPRWQLSLSCPIRLDHLSIPSLMIPPLGQENSQGKTQYIHGKQVLVDCRRFILLQRGFKHIVICLKFCCHHVIMTFPPEWITALAVICSMCVRAIFNSTFRKHQSLSKSKHNHCQLNKFWTLNSRHIPFFTFFSSPLVYVLWRCQWLHLFFPEKL